MSMRALEYQNKSDSFSFILCCLSQSDWVANFLLSCSRREMKGKGKDSERLMVLRMNAMPFPSLFECNVYTSYLYMGLCF